ncbi:MAG TPA: hypothetical protein VKJ07_04630, partial [Mycobacteriales bacterium]|nr:hypothetical protein [Mycobacteriales bacterium]
MFIPASASEKKRAPPPVFVSKWTVKPPESIETKCAAVRSTAALVTSRMHCGIAELLLRCPRAV